MVLLESELASAPDRRRLLLFGTAVLRREIHDMGCFEPT
jgi:hypothetical protein